MLRIYTAATALRNEIIAIREMYGRKNGERILHAAHRATTTHFAWAKLQNLLIIDEALEYQDSHESA